MSEIDIIIADTIENGSLNDLLNLREEIRSEKTNNRRDLIKLNHSINERYKYV